MVQNDNDIVRLCCHVSASGSGEGDVGSYLNLHKAKVKFVSGTLRVCELQLLIFFPVK